MVVTEMTVANNIPEANQNESNPDEAVKAWTIGNAVGMTINDEEEVVSYLRRSQRKIWKE